MSEDTAQTELTSKLINSLYTEAMVLADEARAYFDQHGRDDRLALDPVVRVSLSCESLKVTTRLMHVIAWILTQRAVGNGEITLAQTRQPGHRLGKASESDMDMVARLPEAAVALIEASRELYERVRRLDEEPETEPTASPARNLLNRLRRSL